MGATQACSSMDKASPCTFLQSSRPVDMIEVPSGPSKSHARKSSLSLWTKCKDAVSEFRSFQRFLMKQYSGPSQAFDLLSEGCKDSPRNCITREDFTRVVKKVGFKGDSALVFAMLKDGADDFITRDSFRRRLKGRPNKKGDDFAAVVGQAVAFAALERGVSESTLDRVSQGWGRGRSPHRDKEAENFGLSRGRSKDSLRTESTAASSEHSCRASVERRAGKDHHSPKERKRRSRSSSKKRSVSPSPPGHRRRSSGHSSKSPESSKRNKSLYRQKSR